MYWIIVPERLIWNEYKFIKIVEVECNDLKTAKKQLGPLTKEAKGFGEGG